MNQFLRSFLRLLITLFVFSLSLFATAQTPDANGIVYVKSDGNGNGSSWANATSNFQGAINATGAKKIYVAQGSYHIPHFSQPSNSGFIVNKNLEIYGGFIPEGNTTDWNTRILSNRGMGDGSVLEALWENLATVLKFNNLNASTVFDGFTITGGTSGGIINSNASPTFRNLIITGNIARVGGGIYNYNSSPIITDVIIYNNSAYTDVGSNTGLGGAIYNSGNSSPVLTNVLLTANSTDVSGGGAGIYHAGTGNMQLINATMHNNLAGLNGGAPNAITIKSGTVTIGNSIIYGGITGTYSAQYSMIEGNTNFTNGNIDASGFPAGNVFISPISGLTSNLGNYTLSPVAPAIDAGSNALFADLDINSKDLVGNSRVLKYSSSSVIDMGAYESQFVALIPTVGIIYVKPTGSGTEDGSSWDNATSDLHTAIQATGVTKVFVAIGNYNVGDHSFIMKNGVEIYGGFDPANNIKTLSDTRILPNLTIEGSILNGQNVRPVIWNVFTAGNPLNNSSLLDGFTVKNGNYGANGGGIRNIYAAPVFNHLVIKNNTANNSSGGGVYNDYSSPKFSNTIITNNSGWAGGGGIFSEHNSTLLLVNVLSFGNSSDFGNELANGAGGVTTTLINSTIIGTRSNDVRLTANDVLINSIIPNGINNSTTTPTLAVFKNSLVKGAITGDGNGNIDAAGFSLSDIFVNPTIGDYTLQGWSVAINAGDNSLYTNLDADTKDLANNSRVYHFDIEGKIDLGAYEYQGDPIVLPIILMNYTAKAQGKEVKLQWTTATESNSKEFIISRSSDGNVYREVGKVNGAGNSSAQKNYTFYDNNPADGINYYRLQQKDFDGKITDYGVRKVTFSTNSGMVKLYPNPVKDILKIEFSAGKYHQIELIDNTGRILQLIGLSSIENQKTLQMSNYNPGVYFIRLTGANTLVQKVVKE